jgi:hypothetical protein
MMLEKKISSLKNIIFIKGSLCAILIVFGLWAISFLRDEYADSQDRVDLIKPVIAETQIKLNEITGSNSDVSEGIKKYNEIYGKTEEARCKEYNDILNKIGALRSKYNLLEPVSTVLSRPSKLNISRNKVSHISVYDLKIEFGSYDIAEVFEIYNDILSLLPEYSLVYLVEMKESSAINPQNITILRADAKPLVMKCKIYVKIRDVVYTKIRN